MDWLTLLVHFGGGVFLTNAIPHLGHGISGYPFQTPFANPPGRGQSSPLVNVLWGASNLALGYLLITAGGFELGASADALAAFGGGLLTALLLGWHFGRVHREH